MKALVDPQMLTKGRMVMDWNKVKKPLNTIKIMEEQVKKTPEEIRREALANEKAPNEKKKKR